MESLVVCIGERRSHVAELVRGDQEPLSFGRGLNNTVVLTDPYVGERQLEFFKADGHWFVKIDDDVNPVLVNDEVATDPVFALTAGDRITIGRTHLDIYPADYAIEPARKLIFSKWLYSGRSALAVAIFAMLAVALIDAGLDYFTYAKIEDWKAHVSTIISTSSLLLVWAACWSLVGRVARHQAHFSVQLLVTSVVAGVILLVMPLASYVDYLLSSATAGEITGYLLATISLALLLRWNIYFATHPARPWLLAGFISVLCMATYFAMSLLEEPAFEAKPQFSSTLKPPFAPRSGGETIDDYLARVNLLAGQLKSSAEDNKALQSTEPAPGVQQPGI